MVPKRRSESYYACLVFPALNAHETRGPQRVSATIVLLWGTNLSLPFDFPEFAHIILFPKSSCIFLNFSLFSLA